MPDWEVCNHDAAASGYRCSSNIAMRISSTLAIGRRARIQHCLCLNLYPTQHVYAKLDKYDLGHYCHTWLPDSSCLVRHHRETQTRHPERHASPSARRDQPDEVGTAGAAGHQVTVSTPGKEGGRSLANEHWDAVVPFPSDGQEPKSNASGALKALLLMRSTAMEGGIELKRVDLKR